MKIMKKIDLNKLLESNKFTEVLRLMRNPNNNLDYNSKEVQDLFKELGIDSKESKKIFDSLK